MRKSKATKLPIERDGIKAENPEKYYDFGEEVGRGKLSIVRRVKHKETGKEYAAKMINFDDGSLKFAIREYDLMTSGKMNNKALVQLHEAYLVRKYLILIMELCDGKTLLDQVSSRHSISEEDVAVIIVQLCEVLVHLHSNNIIHLDVRPTNIRFSSARDIKLLDYNSARQIANKKAGEVVDVIGDTEFCAPEMLQFDPVQPPSDMWSVAIIMYILISGISPFYYEDEKLVLTKVGQVQWEFDEESFKGVTSEAKDFIKKCLVRAPEMRMTASAALIHPWLAKTLEGKRKRSVINCQDVMKETDERLYDEEEDDYVYASFVFRTFEQEEYESPEVSSEEESEGEEN